MLSLWRSILRSIQWLPLTPAPAVPHGHASYVPWAVFYNPLLRGHHQQLFHLHWEAELVSCAWGEIQDTDRVSVQWVTQGETHIREVVGHGRTTVNPQHSMQGTVKKRNSLFLDTPILLLQDNDILPSQTSVHFEWILTGERWSVWSHHILQIL